MHSILTYHRHALLYHTCTTLVPHLYPHLYHTCTQCFFVEKKVPEFICICLYMSKNDAEISYQIIKRKKGAGTPFRRVPSEKKHCLYPTCTTRVPHMYHTYTTRVPRVYHTCTTLAQDTVEQFGCVVVSRVFAQMPPMAFPSKNEIHS